MQPCASHHCHIVPGPLCVGHARKWPGHAGSWPSGHDVLCNGCSSEGSLFYPWESPWGSPWLHTTGSCTHQWFHPVSHALHGLLSHTIFCSSVCRLGLSRLFYLSIVSDNACLSTAYCIAVSHDRLFDVAADYKLCVYIYDHAVAPLFVGFNELLCSHTVGTQLASCTDACTHTFLEWTNSSRGVCRASASARLHPSALVASPSWPPATPQRPSATWRQACTNDACILRNALCITHGLPGHVRYMCASQLMLRILGLNALFTAHKGIMKLPAMSKRMILVGT